MTAPAIAEYDLFLDESGLFLETSTNPVELARALEQERQFPSQLAGVLAPRGQLTAGASREILAGALGAAGLDPDRVHARNLGKASYDTVVNRVVAELVRRGWQPVRLVNKERVRYGDRVAAYTNLVAELVLRICRLKRQEGQPRVAVRLYCARLVLGEDDKGQQQFLEREEYQRRVTEYLDFAAVRAGQALESSSWRLADLQIRSARKDPELQLADVISHASHDDFHPCAAATAEVLRQSLGAYDFTLTVRELLERVQGHLANGLPALALMDLADRLVQDVLEPDVKEQARQKLGEVIDRLVEAQAPARDMHLAMLAGWLEQIIEAQRSLELGYRLARWLLAGVERPLRQRLAGRPDASSLDWFAYALHTWALTACNHRGTLGEARAEAEPMQALLASLAGQWEHATLLMRGLVARAVHQTDTFDYAGADAQMRIVSDYYTQLGELFHVALPAVFPQRVRSDLLGRALGTWLQSEIYAGLVDPSHLEQARRLSERAIDEFPAQADRERQYQYRAQLETAAGDFPQARHYLARSLRLEQADHATLGKGIAALGESSPFAQGFALLHWLRLGASAGLAGAEEEWDSFRAALRESSLLEKTWCRGEPADYPVHGILRRVAVIWALDGDGNQAGEALRRLGEILDGDPTEREILQAVRLASQAEVAALLARAGEGRARKLLDSTTPGRPGLRQLLDGVKGRTETRFPTIWQTFAPWPAAVEKLLAEPKTEAAQDRLLRLARAIGY